MGRVIIGEQTTPATPGAGFVTLFPKSDHVLYMIDENGVETVVATLPVTDTVTLIKGSVDSTKQIRFEVDGLTTETTRVLTVPDKNITLDGGGDSRPPSNHASNHINGTDDIQNATNAQKGLATAAHITAIEANTSTNHTQGTDTTLGTMTSNVNMNTHKLTTLSVPSSNGDSIRATAKITEAKLEAADDHVAATNPHSGSAGSGSNSDITSLGAHNLTGTLSLSEQAILVDAALASDHTWTGPTQSVTAGEELTIGEVAYLKSDGKYWLADADAEATADTKLVMATATIAADAAGIVLLPSALSFFRDDSTTEWTVTAAGDVMFLSTTDGELTNDVSGYTTGDIVRVCGYMETTTILNFNVDSTYIEIT